MSQTASPWQRPFPPSSADVVVVGGGIIGTSTAYMLRLLRPELRVVLVEGGMLGAGASGRNAGFLIPGTHTDFSTAVCDHGFETARRILEFTLENVDLVRELDGEAFDLDLSDCLVAAGSKGEADRLRASADLLDRLVACEWLDREATARRSGGGRFEGGLLLRAGGTLDPVKLVRYLAARSGVEVVENFPVESISSTSGGLVVGGKSGQIEAGSVVLCLNAFLPRLIDRGKAWVRPVRAQMLATEPLPTFLNLPIYSHEGYFYIRQRTDGRVMLGGARHLHEAEEVGYDTITTPAVQTSLEAYLREHFPDLGGASIERRWSGTMGFSPDSLPVFGHLDELPGTHFACGFTGHGMGYGLRFGRLMARTALGEADPAADLFSAHRFDNVE